MELNMNNKRHEKELPDVIIKRKWQYHHLGIPTTEVKENEIYIPSMKFYVSGFSTSPYGIEWMRFLDDSPVNPLIKKVPHLAFVVPDIQEAVKGEEVICEPYEPMAGIIVAMIVSDGAPVELMEIHE